MILVGAIMLSNNIRDIVGDREGGRKTMAILVGSSQCCLYFIALLYRLVLMDCRFSHY